jgi:hypothetical protein
MNRTIKDATGHRFYYATHESLRAHLATFLEAYNFAKRLKSLRESHRSSGFVSCAQSGLRYSDSIQSTTCRD